MTASHIDERDQTEALRARLAEAEDMLRAIQHGEIDALVVEGAAGHQVYTLHSAEEPYRHLVEQMQEGAVVLTADGDILYANARFAALVGEPPAQYLSRWRMSVADDTLVRNDVSLPELAEQSGYASEDAFARVFKRHFGLTPAAFRRERTVGAAS